MVIQLKKPGIGEAIRGASSGLDYILQAQQQRQNQLQQEQQQQSKQISELNKLVGSYAERFQLGNDLSPEQFIQAVQLSQSFINQGLNPHEAVQNAFKQFFDTKSFDLPSSATPEEKNQIEEDQGEVKKGQSFISQLMDELSPFSRGLQSRALGRISALSAGESLEDFEKRVASQEGRPPIAQALRQAGSLLSDLPFFLTGGALGGASGTAIAPGIGTAAGAGAGAFALPELLDTGLKEYQDFLDQGGEASFGDFLQRAERTAESGVKAGALGSILASLGGAVPLLKNASPQLRNLLDAKPAGRTIETAATTAVEAAGLLGAQAAAERRLPSTEEVINTLTLVGAFNLAKLGAKSKERLAKKVNESGISPEEFAQRVKTESAKENVDLNDNKKVASLINRVSKEKPSIGAEKATRVAGEVTKETELPSSRKEGKLTPAEEQERYFKRTKRVREEIAEEKGRREEKAEKEKKKTPPTRAKEEKVREEARKALPRRQKVYEDARSAMNKGRDELSYAKKANLPAEEIQKRQKAYDRLKFNSDSARQEVVRLRNEMKSGKPFLSDRSIKITAFNDAENILQKVRSLSEKEILKENKLEKLAEKMAGRRTIPGQNKITESTFDRVQRFYREAYENKLADINKQLRSTALSAEKRNDLTKARDILQKLVKQKKGRYRVGRRRHALSQMGERQAKKERFQKMVKVGKTGEAIPKKVSERVLKTTSQEAEATLKKEAESLSEDLKEEVKKEKAQPKKETREKMRLSTSGKRIIAQGIQRISKKLFGKPLSATASYGVALALGKFLGISGWLTPIGLYNRLESTFDALNMLNLSPNERLFYKRELKRKGRTPTNIKRTEKYYKAFKKGHVDINKAA